MQHIPEPHIRSKLRRKLGREYYILRRKLQWRTSNIQWAQQQKSDCCNHVVFAHKSLILRELAGVDMQLQRNKRRNLELAIRHLDGLVLYPSSVFSVWKNVGRPSARKGYLEGLVLHQGTIQSGIGGGLCQLGNLLFWMFAHSPLHITERFRHGFDVFPDTNRTVPFGAGATLAYNYIDLQAINSTKSVFSLHLWLSDTHLHGELRSDTPMSCTYTIEERNHRFTQQYWGGYSRHNEIYKITVDSKGNEQERLLVENNAILMYEPFLSASTSQQQL